MVSDPKKAQTPEFRVSFPFVFQPQPAMEEGKPPRYSVVMLFKPGENLSALKRAAAAAVKEKWGDKPPKGMRNPFRDQGEKDFEGYEDGAIFVTATSRDRPGLVDGELNDIIDSSEFYAGCYARATIRAFTYDRAGNKGVSFGLQNIQKLRDGESLTSRVKARDDFEPVEAAMDDADADDGSQRDAETMFG